jgi:D-aspartate ligase
MIIPMRSASATQAVSRPRPSVTAPACVLGEVDLVRALSLQGIRSVVVAQPGNPARYSRATASVVPWTDPRTRPAALVERLLDFAASQPTPPVLYYDGDWDLLLISRFRDQLEQAFRFVIADAELVEDLVDKARFQALAERLGLPVPRGRRLSTGEPLPDDIDLRFPVVAKPLTRSHDTWKRVSSAKAAHAGTPAELHAIHALLAGSGADLLVQEVVPGPESRIESYHVYVDAGGAVAGDFTGRKLRTHPPGYGYSTALTITSSAEVLELGRELTARLGLRGVAKFDFKRGPDERLQLLEINPRFNLWHHPGALAGVNLPALVYHDLLGLSRAAPAPVRAGVRWCSLAHDSQAARAEGIGTARWLAWAIRCEAKSGFAWDDPLPLVRAVGWRVAGAIRRRLGA